MQGFCKWWPFAGRCSNPEPTVEGAVLQVCAYLGSNQGPPACEVTSRLSRGTRNPSRQAAHSPSATPTSGRRSRRTLAGLFRVVAVLGTLAMLLSGCRLGPPADIDRAIGSAWLTKHGVPVAETDCDAYSERGVQCSVQRHGVWFTFSLTCAKDGACMVDSVDAKGDQS